MVYENKRSLFFQINKALSVERRKYEKDQKKPVEWTTFTMRWAARAIKYNIERDPVLSKRINELYL